MHIVIAHKTSVLSQLAMERLEGHINPLSSDKQVGVESLDVSGFVTAQSFGLEEEEEFQQLSTSRLIDTIPFLQMVQLGESSPFLSLKEPNFLALLSLQHLKNPWELKSYLMQEVPDFHSPMKSENNGFYQNPTSTSGMEEVNLAVSSQKLTCNRLETNMRSGANVDSSSSPPVARNSRNRRKRGRLATETTRERRKRKRTAATKNKEEVDNQRMTHIAVERNRRRQMNDHLNSLRFLMPPSFLQRGDQASVIGGAIDFVKVLEQLLQSLEAQRKTQQRSSQEESRHGNSMVNPLTGISSNDLRTMFEEQTSAPRVEATVIQNHVNLKIQCSKKQGQLLKAIISLEELRLTVLHLNVSSSDAFMFYSFNLKMEDDCNLGSADEIAAAVHKMFEQNSGSFLDKDMNPYINTRINQLGFTKN